MSNLNETLKGYLSFLDNQYVVAILAVVLVLYASLAAPKLPFNVVKFLDYDIVKLLFVFLIGFIATKNPMLSILVALAFIITIITLNKHNDKIDILDMVKIPQDSDIQQDMYTQEKRLNPHDMTDYNRDDDMYKQFDEQKKRVTFKEENKGNDINSPFEVLGKGGKYQDTYPPLDLGSYDEKGFSEQNLQ